MLYRTYKLSPSARVCICRYNTAAHVVNSTYKAVDDINEELKDFTISVGIANRINVMIQTDLFITLKDHDDNFDTEPNCRLINPAKSYLGKVSKVILDTK